MIIDMHAHIGGQNNKVGNNEAMSEDDVIYAMKTYKIDKVIVSNADCVECDGQHNLFPPEKQISQYNANVRTINFARDYEGVFVAVWVMPNCQRLSKQFTDLISRNLDVVKAIKVHPFYSALKFSDERLLEYIDLAQKLDLPIIVHTATDQYSSPKEVFEVAKKNPTVKFVMAHMELGSDNTQAISFAQMQQNLYADTAWVPINSAIRFIKSCSSERLMFGSDMPIDGRDTYSKNRNGSRSLYQDYFFELNKYISFYDYENVMYKSAQRVFKI